MAVELPTPFSMKDLFIDVDLTACVDGTAYDFTGKKTFNTKFYRDNIGFGITDINVEINPSLLPLVEITFKDLYGNTIFGTQTGSEIDYSVLFNWPPPKFLFSFKGYLGKKVTWILNLKRHDVNFNSSDGSYTIRCSFVPNQWGFFADVPFLYLLSVKYLRKNYYAKTIKEGGEINICNDNKIKAPKLESDLNILSTFDLVKMGRQVELKTKETTKEFDEIRKQMTDAKYTAAQSLYKTKTLELDRQITGDVNGIPISNSSSDGSLTFTPILFDSGAWSEDFPDDQTINTILKLPTEIGKINAFMLTKMKVLIDGVNPVFVDTEAETIRWREHFKDSDWRNTDTPNGKLIKRVQTAAIDYLDGNLKLIDEEIKRRVFNSSKSQLGKITISQVFSQISRDSALILGLIIEKGLSGYDEFKDQRDSEVGSLIGKSFPLFIGENGEELPATTNNGMPINVGVEKHEMQFVREFIESISHGISENLTNNNISSAGDEYKLVKRINNLEAPKQNPYRPFYKNIAENILIRSGIAAFITRSNDPNTPGSYGNLVQDNDSDWENIVTLAKADLENITDDMISQLSFTEKSKLLRFCKFFDRLIIADEGGDFMNPFFNKLEFFDYLNPVASIVGIGLNGYLENTAKPYDTAVPDSVLDLKVIMSDFDQQRVLDFGIDEDSNTEDVITALGTAGIPVETLTLRQLLVGELLGQKPATVQRVQDTDGYPNVHPITGEQVNSSELPIQAETNDDSLLNTSFIDPITLTASCLKNNGLYYCYPTIPFDSSSPTQVGTAPSSGTQVKESNPYWVVVFEGSEATKALEAKNASSDAEFANEDEYDETDLGYNEPRGIIPIENIYTEGIGSDKKDRVLTVNEYIEDELAVSYESIKKLLLAPVTAQGTANTNLSQFLYNEPITKSGQYAFAAFGNQSKSSGAIIWAPFADDEDKFPGNQRVYIKTMCKGILDKIEELDEKKNQVLGQLLGKASEQENLIYKQMHHIFHQWYTVVGSSADNPCGNNAPEHKGLALQLENEYGGCNKHFSREPNSDLEKVVELDGGSSYFVYDYPLQHMTGTNLKGEGKVDAAHSIINIDPLSESDANTTVLNMIQQICTKNNFVFIPFPGDIGATSVKDIYKPYSLLNQPKIINHFHVMFSPTPESRSLLTNEKLRLGDFVEQQKDFAATAINIQFGSIYNQIVNNLNVGTQETKPTAESIINLQRLVDNENQNKQVTTDCSMLSVMEGRSYKATCDIIGNSQIYPMQFFFLDKIQLFSGLYQIMKVTHKITPNNMETSFEGIRMRFTPNNKYGGIPPVTYEDFVSLGPLASGRTQVSFSANMATERIKVNEENAAHGAARSTGRAQALSVLTPPANPKGPIAVASAPNPVSVAGFQLYPSGEPFLSGKSLGLPITCVSLSYQFLEQVGGYLVNEGIAPHLLALIRDAKAHLVTIGSSTKVTFSSAFRTNAQQEACRVYNLKQSFRSQIYDGSGAITNQALYNEIILTSAGSIKRAFSPLTATPGYSKHQSGIAVDINGNALGFGGKPRTNMSGLDLYTWLVGNAHKYGFIRTVASEGWHWEYRPGFGAWDSISRNNGTWLGIPDELAKSNSEFA